MVKTYGVSLLVDDHPQYPLISSIWQLNGMSYIRYIARLYILLFNHHISSQI